MEKILKYMILSLVLVASGVVVSCVYDEYPIENETEKIPFDGDVLKFTFTLDNMGGEMGTRAAANLEKWENFVDVEKVRVLVFDNNDKFLFESKNRWIKQLDPSPDHSTWSVAIPMGSYGNDKDYDWEWDEIRKRMSTNSFKIALLVNRPDREWNMGILKRWNNPENNNNEEDVDPDEKYEGVQWTGTPYLVPGGWFGSTGPHWDRTNSIASYTDEEDNKDVKDVFDLHHCQYDPIYHGKNFYTTNGSLKNTNQNFYGCITEGAQDYPYMGATSSWVDWGVNDNVRDGQGWDYRKTILPSEKHPIPMYGIQSYAPLEGWKKGTTVNLDRVGDKAISLLRSVVKLELLVPKGTAAHVLLFYSNIYARCEPMDVWTPTDQLWTSGEKHDKECEWNLIKDFRMTEANDVSDNTIDSIKGSRRKYQQRLSRLYGIWRKDKKWSFNDDNDNDYYKTDDNDDINKFFDTNYSNSKTEEFVKIFNPCVQRNTAVYVEKCPGYESDLVYDHFVAYVGERSINDASNLGQLGNNGGGNCTVIYWSIVGTNINPQTVSGQTYYYRDLYSLPIIDYSNAGSNLAKVLKKGYCFNGEKPGNGSDGIGPNKKDGSSTNMGGYARKVQASGLSGAKYYDANFDQKYWPLPLLRNHVYSITLTSVRSNYDEDGMPFAVHFEENHTENISFQ